MTGSGATLRTTDIDVLKELKLKEKKTQGQIRENFTGIHTADQSLTGFSNGGQAIENSPLYLNKGGDTMNGPLAIGNPFGDDNTVEIDTNNTIDIGSETTNFGSSLFLVDGDSSVLDIITNTTFDGQLLWLKAGALGLTISQHTALNGGNIQTTDSNDISFDIPQEIFLKFDSVLAHSSGGQGVWRVQYVTLGGDNTPDPTEEFQHLQSDGLNNWIAQKELEFGTTSANSANLRMPNDTIGIAWRTSSNTGNIEIKTTNTDILDITNSANDSVILSLRAQDVSFSDISMSLTQLSNIGGLGGSTIFSYPTELSFNHGAELIALLDSMDGINFFKDVDMNQNRITNTERYMFTPISDADTTLIGEIYETLTDSNLRYKSNNSHVFATDGQSQPLLTIGNFAGLGGNLLDIAVINLVDSTANPNFNGEIQMNGIDVKVFSGGAIRNFSDIGVDNVIAEGNSNITITDTGSGFINFVVDGINQAAISVSDGWVYNTNIHLDNNRLSFNSVKSTYIHSGSTNNIITVIDSSVKSTMSDSLFLLDNELSLLNSHKITNVLDPTNLQDVVTKNYGDINYGVFTENEILEGNSFIRVNDVGIGTINFNLDGIGQGNVSDLLGWEFTNNVTMSKEVVLGLDEFDKIFINGTMQTDLIFRTGSVINFNGITSNAVNGIADNIPTKPLTYVKVKVGGVDGVMPVFSET